MARNDINHARYADVDSKTRALEEISETAAALYKLALSWKLDFVAYLIEMVYIEAEKGIEDDKK